MAGTSTEKLSVYRLLPGLSDHQALSFNSSDVQRIMRWHRTGAEMDRPARLRAAWMEEKGWPKGDFPSGYPSAPVVSLRIVEQFGDGLRQSGACRHRVVGPTHRDPAGCRVGGVVLGYDVLVVAGADLRVVAHTAATGRTDAEKLDLRSSATPSTDQPTSDVTRTES